ncbi:MATE family efflux transporter [Vibrio sp. ZSDE26]|uniref:Multidrug resistance protein NorM n=1 Tax=Vibrio amylolyticus TaxID=2847292 RepID=A0A9X2BK58_9VIBR|nr:MATE family efflux transporter [Vibrio amylolyticus]MCK6262478.1 MATE family efflux transporter [Vibrio amylolyticus]
MPNTAKRMSIIALTWPIFIEILLRTALNTSDVFMLSSYSDKAVSAIGVVTQISFFLLIVSSMVSSGCSILIAQYLGAGNKEKSHQVNVASFVLALAVGFLLSLFAYFAAFNLLPFFQLEPEVLGYATEYLAISGSFTFVVTFGVVISTIMRCYGYSKSPMIINLIAGVINLLGNYIALYQPFGLPVFGVSGVATATVVSQIISTCLLFYMLRQRSIPLKLAQYRSVPRAIYKKIVKIGALNAGEVLSYNLAQMTIMVLVISMGTASVAAFTYAQNIARLAFAFSLALGQATQIQAGYYIGKQYIDEIWQRVQWYFVAGFAVSVTFTTLFYLFRYEIVGIFTHDPMVTQLTVALIGASIILEAGRAFNLVFISALKASGDIKFPVKMGILSMWGIGVVMSYILGIHWSMGVLGAWIAIAMDEWFRGLIMARRWRSKVWLQFKL